MDASEVEAQVEGSIAAYPRWISLFFAGGARLDDPHLVLAAIENIVVQN